MGKWELNLKILLDTFLEVVSTKEFKNLLKMRQDAYYNEKLALIRTYEEGLKIGENKAKAKIKARKLTAIEFALKLHDKGELNRSEILTVTNLTEKEF